MCQHHAQNEMKYYSITKRQFYCKECVSELRGTPKEAEINAMKVSEVGTMYQTQVDLQALVNLDQELSHLLQQFKQTRYHMHNDKKSVIKSIHDVFDSLQNTLEERREEVLAEVKKEYKG